MASIDACRLSESASLRWTLQWARFRSDKRCSREWNWRLCLLPLLCTSREKSSKRSICGVSPWRCRVRVTDGALMAGWGREVPWARGQHRQQARRVVARATVQSAASSPRPTHPCDTGARYPAMCPSPTRVRCYRMGAPVGRAVTGRLRLSWCRV